MVRIKVECLDRPNEILGASGSLLQGLVIARSRSTPQHRMAFDLVVIHDCIRDADFC